MECVDGKLGRKEREKKERVEKQMTEEGWKYVLKKGGVYRNLCSVEGRRERKEREEK